MIFHLFFKIVFLTLLCVWWGCCGYLNLSADLHLFRDGTFEPKKSHLIAFEARKWHFSVNVTKFENFEIFKNFSKIMQKSVKIFFQMPLKIFLCMLWHHCRYSKHPFRLPLSSAPRIIKFWGLTRNIFQKNTTPPPEPVLGGGRAAKSHF